MRLLPGEWLRMQNLHERLSVDARSHPEVFALLRSPENLHHTVPFRHRARTVSYSTEERAEVDRFVERLTNQEQVTAIEKGACHSRVSTFEVATARRECEAARASCKF